MELQLTQPPPQYSHKNVQYYTQCKKADAPSNATRILKNEIDKYRGIMTYVYRGTQQKGCCYYSWMEYRKKIHNYSTLLLGQYNASSDHLRINYDDAGNAKKIIKYQTYILNDYKNGYEELIAADLPCDDIIEMLELKEQDKYPYPVTDYKWTNYYKIDSN